MAELIYEKERKNIHSGDMLAWTHKGWGSFYDLQVQAVRFATQSEYCHVATAWVTSGRVFVIEAVVPKVRIYPLSMLGDFFHMPMKKRLSKEALEFALSQVGEPYSKWMAIKSLWNQVKPGDSGEWQCAKLTAEINKKNGIDYGTAYTPSKLIEAGLADGKDLRIIKNK